jgi:hypothetical protein
VLSGRVVDAAGAADRQRFFFQGLAYLVFQSASRITSCSFWAGAFIDLITSTLWLCSVARTDVRARSEEYLPVVLIRYHGVIHVTESTRKHSAAANAWPDASRLPRNSTSFNPFQIISKHSKTDFFNPIFC